MSAVAPDSIRFRVPDARDVPDLARVHLAAWLDAYRGVCDRAWLDSLAVEMFQGYHRPKLTPGPDPREPFLVAERDERIVGFARAGPTRDKSPTGDPLPEGFASRWSCELYAIYVDPAHQRHGIGRRLFLHVVRRLHELGHRSMCLWVLSGNAKARRFYERAGGVALPDVAPITLGNRAYEQTAYVWHALPLDVG
jgi:GNAT superfamily N-acetyltransferase